MKNPIVGVQGCHGSLCLWACLRTLFEVGTATDVLCVCCCVSGMSLSGSDAVRALGQVSLSPMLEDEGSIPIRDIRFSPLICNAN